MLGVRQALRRLSRYAGQGFELDCVCVFALSLSKRDVTQKYLLNYY